MASSLLPELTGQTLNVNVALKTPQTIEHSIADALSGRLLLEKFFSPYGNRVVAGGILYSPLAVGDAFAGNVERRAPGTQYRRVEPVRPEKRLALVEDWGATIEILDETRDRSDIREFSNQLLGLTNSLQLRLDAGAMEAINAADIEVFSPETNWSDLVFVGPLDQITPSSQRPSAHIAEAQMLAAFEELGARFNLMVINPTQEFQLRRAYAEGLRAMLDSVGLSLFVNPRVPEGVVYLLKETCVGVVGFERPLTVDVIDDRKHRRTEVQAYAVPVFVVDSPQFAKKIVLPA